MSNLNWEKLYSQGRCMAPGVPFNDRQDKAVYTYKIPIDYVRAGIETLEDYREALAKEEETGEKPLDLMEREDLVKIAQKLGIKISPSVIKETLITEIKKRTKIKENQAEEQANIQKAIEIEEDFQAKESAKAKVKKDKAFKKAINAGLDAKEKVAKDAGLNAKNTDVNNAGLNAADPSVAKAGLDAKNEVKSVQSTDSTEETKSNGADQDPKTEDQGNEDTTGAEPKVILKDLKRDEIEVLATRKGIENAKDFANKGDLIDAIEKVDDSQTNEGDNE